MKRTLWSLMCVVVASLLCQVNSASAADPPGFKPWIKANPGIVKIDPASNEATTHLVYDAGTEHPDVEVYVSINGGKLLVAQGPDGSGSGTLHIQVKKEMKYRYILMDAGKELASVEVFSVPGRPGQTTISPAPTNHPGDLPRNIVKFAGSNLGQKGLGDGQCTRLIEQALAAAGAKPGKNYVWGRALKEGEAMRMGDIIQFTKFVIKKDAARTYTLGDPNHTAIISGVTGKAVTLFHQNLDGNPATEKSRVRSHGFVFDKEHIVSGSYIVYRPELK